MLALLLAWQYFPVYVGSSSSSSETIYTDYTVSITLIFLLQMYNHNQNLMRWSLIIQDYNLEIKHKKNCIWCSFPNP